MKTSRITIILLSLILIAVKADPVKTGTHTTAKQASRPEPIAASKGLLPKATAFTVVDRGANQRVWERYTYEKAPDGRIVPKKHQYVELAGGMHYLKNGKWVESKEEIEILPNGTAQAVQGQHQVYFPGDIYRGAIIVVTPDRKQLQSRPLGLFYDDGKNTVLIAGLTNTVGGLAGPNQVVYPNAFTGLGADLVYTYRKSGFEQDVVLREQPPSPEKFGLDPQTTRLEVLTEFFDKNEPSQTAATTNQRDGLRDNTLTFGKMKMVKGRAFSVNGSDQNNSRLGGTPTYKSWLHLGGRTFLMEELPYQKIEAQLEQLPLTGKINAANTSLIASGSILNNVSIQQLGRLLPPAMTAQMDTHKIQLAKVDFRREPGVVLDYQAVDTGEADFTFQGDTTYYISDSVNLSGTTTIEGGAVIKYDTNYNCAIGIAGSIKCATAPYRPAILTSADDNTVGEPIDTSGVSSSCTGTLNINVISDIGVDVTFYVYDDNGNCLVNLDTATAESYQTSFTAGFGQHYTALAYDDVYGTCYSCDLWPTLQTGWLDVWSDTDNTYLTYSEYGNPLCTHHPVSYPYSIGLSLCNGGSLHDLNFRNLGYGIDSAFDYSITNCEFVHCGVALCTEFLTVYAGNILMSDVGTGFWGYGFQATAEHLTYDQGDHLVAGMNGSSLTLANSLVTGVGDVTGVGGYGNVTIVKHVVESPSGSGVYQTVGAGSYYLPDNSPYHNAGTASISPSLRAQLARKTTHPPVVYSGGTISAPTTLSPQAPRDNNAVLDLGYHYDPLDYVFAGVEAQSDITFTAGTAVGWYDAWGGDAYGIRIDAGAAVSFNGTATSPCWLSRYDTVQEAANGTWADTGWLAPITCNNPNPFNSADAPRLVMQFTKFSSRSFNDQIRDFSGNFVVSANNCEFYGGIGGYNIQLNFTNCLFYRFGTGITCSGYASPSLSMQNCTTEKGGFLIQHWSGSIWPVSIHDCVFDGTTIDADSTEMSCDYNSFLMNTMRLPVLGAHDVANITSYDWQSSRFGDYYLPSNSPLIDHGSVAANQVGMYHFTTQTSQIKEGNTAADIGYHYVAADGSGNPIETDGDGLPDYIEDSNGNGVYDAGDFSDWQNPFTDGSGMDDGWEVKYFGQINIDPYADPDSDGYDNLEEYQNGTNPTVFNSPPKGVTSVQVLRNPVNTANVTVSWQAVPSATSYIITRTINGVVTTYTVAAGTTSWTDTSVPAGSSPTYTVTSNYPGGGNPSPSPSGNPDYNPLLAVDPEIVRGPTPSDSSLSPLQLVLGGPVPSDVAAIRVHKIINPAQYRALVNHGGGNYTWEFIWYAPPNWYLNWPGNIDGGSFDVPINQFLNGIYQIPWSRMAKWGQYSYTLQPVGKDGRPGVITPQNFVRNAPFVDGSAVVKQNLSFLMRSARGGDSADYGTLRFKVKNGYAQASPYLMRQSISQPAMDELSPFYENYFLHNWIYDPDAFFSYSDANHRYFYFYPGNNIASDGVGYDTTTVYYEFNAYYFITTGNASLLTPQFSANDPIYLNIAYPNFINDYGDYDTLNDCGVFWDDGAQQTVMAASWDNYFGLTYQKIRILQNRYPFGTTVPTVVDLLPGNAYSDADPNNYSEYFQQVNAPSLTTVDYYFGRAGATFGSYEQDPLPGDDNFAVTDTTPLFITSVGQSLLLYGWAKQSIANGDPTKFGYLGQYFDKAYKTDANGNAISTTTGILSEYGEFLATEPGKLILKTKPDPNQSGLQEGQCPVYAISLNVDANHDGTMDLTYTGPDTTSATTPMRFWANNNYDRLTPDHDDNTSYEDDVSGFIPGTLQMGAPDSDYTSSGQRVIPTKRDLEDYARLWVSGVTSDLLAALPSGSTVTLSWGDVGNPNPNNPTIDLFTAADADGGTGYLTDENTAIQQINSASCPYIKRLGPGQSIQWNANNWDGSHFIWCGVNNGSGALTLTIADGAGKTLAQTMVYIQIVDIKQMYDRWSVGENPTFISPLTPIGFAQYPLSQDPSAPYILFVHGWNLQSWEKDRYAETALKRLYWQGYHGRFGGYHWPTDNGFTGTWFQLITTPNQKDNYDRSEFTAWQSATGLLNLLNTLNTQYSGHVYLFAHSMGNIVAGEALRLSGNNQVVNTYVASQASVSAHTYDPTIANYSFNHPPYSTSASTPNIYGNWFAGNNGGGAGRVINFFNANDFALAPSAWQVDQLLKPDYHVLENGTYWTYGYNGTINDPAPWDNFYKQSSSGIFTFHIVPIPPYTILDRYEVMGYAAESWTTALGATLITTLPANLNLPIVWPPDLVHPLHPYDEHFYHSAEFRGDTSWEWNYWNTLLFSQSGFNISDP